MSDVRTTLNNNVLIEEDLVGTAYTISDMIIISLAYHDIVDKPEEKEHAKNIIRSLVTEWLELVAPIKYVPGLVEEVANTINNKLWDSIVDEEFLERIIVDTLIFKEKALVGDEPEVLEALATVLAARLEYLIEALGGDPRNTVIIYDILYGEKPGSVRIAEEVALAATLLTIATN